MKKSTQIILLIVALFILVFSGGFYMKEQQRKEELKRNREYEVSLVKALKNSYENIEEIKITHPVSTEIPGDWHCTVKISFNEKNMNFFDSRIGKTKKTIKIIFSDGQEKIQ
ncbi:hypothetical protein [Streptococcus agalactiae]|uniref:hypothetical protein n=1 Tax=Streptococcus agalactiae TaxID=1311 RepID=UPI0022EAA0C9|nr:hypothetical protein [Streptococcus agalactiae]